MLAQALRVRLEADILGSRTFGKASLQDFIPLEDGGMIRLSVARAVDPEGETWDREGLEPDHPVDVDDEASEEDRVLLRALEILEEGGAPAQQAA
jgi:carboxyl-terminal processing protease